MSFEELPDDLLIKLFNTASPRDVSRAKRVNRRFHQLVETYNLGKPRVKEFSIESRASITPGQIGRIRFGNAANSHKRRLIVTMKRDKGVKRMEKVEEEEGNASCSQEVETRGFVEQNMRKVVLEDKLSFDGVDINDDFYRMLTAKWNDLRHVNTLSLSFCQIRINWQQFVDLLSRMTLKHLYLDFCTFDTSIISDKVFMSLKHLETIKIQPRVHCYLNELTDQTLSYWSQIHQIPTTLQIYNCASGITVEGIKSLMMQVVSCQQDTINPIIDWDFGLVFEPTSNDSVLLSIIFSPGIQLTVTDDFRSRRIKLHKKQFQVAFNIFTPIPQLTQQIPTTN